MHKLTAAVALGAALLTASPGKAQRRCIATDGDTLRCGAERIRIQGLDAPEMRGRCPAETRSAHAAKERLSELISGGLVLERHGRDRYQRTLAIVRDRQGRDVAVILVREGLARAYDGRGRREGWCG